MEATVILIVVASAAFLLVAGAMVDDHRARRTRVVTQSRLELPLVHSINDDRCIGCQACVDVCPTRVLDLVNHKVKVARFQDCVQCEQCANSCPTTALVMYRQGQTPQTLTVPELDDQFQTAVPGQYLIGEVAGKPLVKNAANLGRAVIEHIAKDLAARPKAEPGIVDAIIVGSGPGGLSAGVTCYKRSLSCVVLEKDHVIASTVSRYPKGKHFMAEPSNAPNLSFLPVFDAKKEVLVAAWKQIADGIGMPIKLGEAVEGITRRDDGVFEVRTTIATYLGRTVVLATGLRGKPRLLAVPGANLEKVQSRLEDPAEFATQDVIVVGGGDSALEAALSLADEGARVTLSYRGGDFKRAKQANQKRIAEASACGTIKVLLESNVKEFTPDQVAIKLKDGSVTTLANQQAFVLIGADTPVAWLENLGVRFGERPHLYALGLTEDLVKRVAPDAELCPRDPQIALAALLGRRSHPTLRSRVGDALHEVSVVMKLPVRAATQAMHAVRRAPPPPIPAHSAVRPPPARPLAAAPVRPPATPAKAAPVIVPPPAHEAWDDAPTRIDSPASRRARFAKGTDELTRTQRELHQEFATENATRPVMPALAYRALLGRIGEPASGSESATRPVARAYRDGSAPAGAAFVDNPTRTSDPDDDFADEAPTRDAPPSFAREALPGRRRPPRVGLPPPLPERPRLPGITPVQRRPSEPPPLPAVGGKRAMRARG